MFSDIEKKIKTKNKILFSRESKCLKELRALICEQKHLTLVLWAFDCLQIPLSELMLKYPNETDIQSAYNLSLEWAHGEIKMPQAQRGILACHAVAKRLCNDYDIALCHAVGQGCSTVHVETHALGLVVYELTAIVVKCSYLGYQDKVLNKIQFYIKRLEWWQENVEKYKNGKKWAGFLVRPDKVNKEKLLTAKLQRL